MPEELELAVTLPREFLHETIVREGDTVEIPLRFRIFRPLPRDVLSNWGSTGVTSLLSGRTSTFRRRRSCCRRERAAARPGWRGSR